jgi:hypothetical protein
MNENKENNLHEELEPHEADTVTSENTELKEDTESGSAVEEDTSKPKSKKKIIGIVVAIIAVIVLAGVGVAYAVGTQPQDEVAEEVEVVDEEPEASAELSVNITCEGWNADTSTPIVIAVYEGDVKDTLLSTEENIEVPDPILTTDVEANKDVLIEEITESGTYTVSIVGSPLLEDGTIFEVPEPQVVEISADEPLTVSLVLTAKAAEDVTEADIAAATAAATTAGVDTTKVQNASNATRSSASTAQGGTISQGQTTAQSKPASSNSSGATSNSSGSTGTSTPSSNSGTTSNNNNGSNSSTNTTNNSSGSSTTQTSQPTHVHNWVYHEAVTSQKTIVVCNVCGARDIDKAHCEQHALNGDPSGNHNEIVSTVVTPAYYSCSCGATK